MLALTERAAELLIKPIGPRMKFLKALEELKSFSLDEQKSTGKLEKRKTPENIEALSENDSNEDDPLAM